MHLPDGLIDPKTATGLGLAAAAVLSFAVQKVHQAVTQLGLAPAFATVSKKIRSISSRARRVLSAEGKEYLGKISFMTGLLFAAQLFDFSIPGATTGHLLGGVLAVVFLGPWGGTLAMSAVLISQAIFMKDGGIAALGANIINMAVLGALVSYYIYQALQKLKIPKMIAIVITAWISIMLVGIAYSLEAHQALQATQSYYALLGLCEALITLGLVVVIKKALGWQLH